MSIAESIAPHLPYLRRYARSLTGSQHSGDNYVAAVLEALIADSSSFDRTLSPRAALYRAFTKVWNSIPVNQERDEQAASEKSLPERRLESITPLPRQAFLLVSVEGFTTAEAAQILDCTPAHITELLQMAGSEIAEQLSADVLIIEDEPLIALDIEDTITSLGHRSVGIARTHKEAVKLAKEKKPQLVLSDIQLADGSSGIDAVNDILGSFDVPVIFITAFPERLLTGERPEPAFLITKPFSPEMVKALIAQALFFDLRSKKAA